MADPAEKRKEDVVVERLHPDVEALEAGLLEAGLPEQAGHLGAGKHPLVEMAHGLLPPMPAFWGQSALEAVQAGSDVADRNVGDQAPSGLEHPEAFPHRRSHVGQVLEDVEADDRLEGCVAEREEFGVRQVPAGRALPGAGVLILEMDPLFGDVDAGADDSPLLLQPGEEPRAMAAKFQHPVAGGQGGALEEGALAKQGQVVGVIETGRLAGHGVVDPGLIGLV